MSYFLQKEIHVEISAGSHRDGAFREMLKLAQESRLPVVGVFNGTVIRTRPEDDLVTMTERWQRDFDRYKG
jgi:hypothetical protein